MIFKLPKRIKVKENHIQDGERNNSRCCPIALAFSETLDESNEMALVSATDISFFVAGTCQWSVHLENKIQHWIENFDLSKDVKPISLTLEETLLGDQYYAIHN